MTMKTRPGNFPEIRRARDYHLFDRNGVRYLDMSLNGGRALLGHRPAGLYTVLKNQMQKGVLAEAPSVYDRRLEKALLRLAGDAWKVRLYRSMERAVLAAGLFLGNPLSEENIREPFSIPGGASRDKGSSRSAAFLRPLSGADYSDFSVLFPVLPFPGGFAPQPVLFVNNPASAGPEPGDAVSPLLTAGLVRVTEELQKTPEFPDIWKDWMLPGWTRRGCYCFPSPAPADYGRIFDRFLASGVLISPDPDRPTILPRIFSPGEKKLVERLCEETAKGVQDEH